ncbi:MAG TPA: hypothetical protein VKX17_08270 [Planctomycetota bacterium]|nr:hypothetical protein [Planctomycetota bacterium]
MQALPNLFKSLFEFRPRDGLTPAENFLTEAFAYILKTDHAARKQWISRLLGDNVVDVECTISTRPGEYDWNGLTTIFPDMLLKGNCSENKQFAIYCEHKWDAPCDPSQLEKYKNSFQKKDPNAKVIFIGSNYLQKHLASKCLGGECCFLWEDVYYEFKKLHSKSNLLEEFLVFLKDHGLSPCEPISIEQMQEYVRSSGFSKSLLRLANKLNTDFSWIVVPGQLVRETSANDEYGFAGIVCHCNQWKPRITFGFYYNTEYCKIDFVDRQKGIDLALCIDIDPKFQQNCAPILEVLRAKCAALKNKSDRVFLEDEIEHKYSVLFIQSTLANVIGDEKREPRQLELLHKCLTNWLEILFTDNSLITALQSLWKTR